MSTECPGNSLDSSASARVSSYANCYAWSTLLAAPLFILLELCFMITWVQHILVEEELLIRKMQFILTLRANPCGLRDLSGRKKGTVRTLCPNI